MHVTKRFKDIIIQTRKIMRLVMCPVYGVNLCERILLRAYYMLNKRSSDYVALIELFLKTVAKLITDIDFPDS